MRRNYIKSRILQIVEVLLWIVLGLFALYLDTEWAISVVWVGYLILGIPALCLALPYLFSRQWQRGLGLFLAFNLALFCLNFLALTPVKPFMQFHRAIAPGMTRDQVQRLFVQYFPANGKFRQPELVEHGPKIQYILDPNDGRYDAEWVMVDFDQGNVINKAYFPD